MTKKQFICRLASYGTVVVLAVALALSVSACYKESKESQYTNDIKNQMIEMYGFPNVNNFFEYSQLKVIYEMRDNPNLICYWYTKNDMSGKWIYQGTCIGYGIPYAASITSPESMQRWTDAYDYEKLPLSEPSGLYVDGLSTTATWILSTNGDGEIHPIYVESEITVSTYKMDSRLCEDWSIPDDY